MKTSVVETEILSEILHKRSIREAVVHREVKSATPYEMGKLKNSTATQVAFNFYHK